MQDHSPPLGGSYSLRLNGDLVSLHDSTLNSYSRSNIPINENLWYVGDALNHMLSAEDISVHSMGNGVDELTFYVLFNTYNQAVQRIVADAALLTGGNGISPPSISITEVQQYSLDAYFEHIPSSFLFSFAETPQVEVTANGIKATCGGDCSYQPFNQKVTVASAALAGSTLSITTTNDLEASLATTVQSEFPGNTVVEFGGSECTGLTGTLASFSCTLPSYSDNSAKVEAGSQKPIVHVDKVGLSDASGVTPIEIGLSPSLQPSSQISNSQPSVAQFTGSGLPLPAYDTKLYAVPAKIKFTYCSFAQADYA